MNASIKLLELVLPATVQLRVQVSPEHPSVPILGSERVGSGTLVDADGLVLTAQYIVLGAGHIEVRLLDGTTTTGDLAAQDFATGIALVKIAAGALPRVALHSSAELIPGQPVFLVASAGDNTRRTGNGAIMSLESFDAYWEYHLDRAITMTAVNPGLSGGAVFDQLGRMVGVVALDLAQIGRFTLAIPVENFLDYRDELLHHGRRITRPRRAWVGLYCYTVRDHLVIAGVLPGTPAEQAGLKPGDVLLSVDDTSIHGHAQLYQQLWTHHPDEDIGCTVFRGNKARQITIRAGDAEEFFA